MALETPSRPPPPPFMANAILNFHFDFLTPSLKGCMEISPKHGAEVGGVFHQYLPAEKWKERQTWGRGSCFQPVAGKSAAPCHYHSVKLTIPGRIQNETAINMKQWNCDSHVLPGNQGLSLPCSLSAAPGDKKCGENITDHGGLWLHTSCGCLV